MVHEALTMDDPSNEELARIRASISPNEVRQQVETVCRSEAFESQKNPQKVLRYLVDESLAGNVPTPEEIAKKALGKKHFDIGDSQVRAEMGKLRRRLKRYYAQAAKTDEIWLEIPERQYSVFWKHSPRTLLGTTESNGRILRAAKLPSGDETKAAETSRMFWPHLASVFPVYCCENFSAQLNDGKLELPVMVKLFFNSIGNYNVFVTSLDRCEIRIYPIGVWLAEWARLKRSNDSSDLLSLSTLVGRNGEDAEIENRHSLTLPPKLLKFLTIPCDPFPLSLFFHPSGYLYFSVPPPPPQPLPKCQLLLLNVEPRPGVRNYYYVLVKPGKRKPLLEALGALNGINKLHLPSFFYILASGHDDPPEGLRDKLLAKYDAIIAEEPLSPAPATPIP